MCPKVCFPSLAYKSWHPWGVFPPFLSWCPSQTDIDCLRCFSTGAPNKNLDTTMNPCCLQTLCWSYTWRPYEDIAVLPIDLLLFHSISLAESRNLVEVCTINFLPKPSFSRCSCVLSFFFLCPARWIKVTSVQRRTQDLVQFLKQLFVLI